MGKGWRSSNRGGPENNDGANRSGNDSYATEAPNLLTRGFSLHQLYSPCRPMYDVLGLTPG
jgi:hypothetical protein